MLEHEDTKALQFVPPHLVWVKCPSCDNEIRLAVMDKAVDEHGRLVLKCRRCVASFWAEGASMLVKEGERRPLNYRRNRPPGGGRG